ncbi:unnamed protein product [Parnassius mnemosyne]|uniref:Reverse transcriptase domain-containing protein n=1 Tax=Parnassius mnemosyne TaxID=213953 RepID=A0AAV1KAE9_9NEOP
MAVRNMKNGKAVGPDGIPVEVWKLLRADGWKWLSLFFGKLLQEEQIPEEWCSSILVPIFKNKGDVQNCSSYRGIKLMSHTMKVWERIIERRMREECEITQNQFGFMPGRGTTDAIFALRQLCEKYKRVHKDLHMVFVDLEKAYDRVPREVLWWALKMKGMPGKYVRLVRAMYRTSRTCVRSAAGTTGSIDVAVGLHQGSALSPYLFLLIMDALTSDLQDEAPWCMLFADDIVLVGEEGIEVQSRLTGWQRRLESVGLKISRSKTEYLCCDFGGLSSPVPMSLDGAILPICSDVKYLGSLIQGDGGIDRAVQHRINAGWMKWRQKFLVVISAAFALVSADVSQIVRNDESQAPILKSDYEINPEGSFQYAYETGNGISAQAQGTVLNPNTDAASLEIQGAARYTSPEGEPVELTYVANEKGYQPSGSHIPQPQPIPELILRSLEYIAAHPPPPAPAEYVRKPLN